MQFKDFKVLTNVDVEGYKVLVRCEFEDKKINFTTNNTNVRAFEYIKFLDELMLKMAHVNDLEQFYDVSFKLKEKYHDIIK